LSKYFHYYKLFTVVLQVSKKIDVLVVILINFSFKNYLIFNVKYILIKKKKN